MLQSNKPNPTILITGCTKGIGLAILEQFAAQGFNVAGCARNANDLTSLFTKLSTEYPKQHFFLEACDASNIGLLKVFASDALKEFGTIDILVNNAGLFEPGNILDEPEGQFEKLFQINLASAYHMSRAIAPSMVQAKKGHIFNICSIASLAAYKNGGSYTIAKFGLYGLSQALREELKTHQVRVSSIMPGATLTQSWEGVDLPEERFMKPEDVAKIVWTSYELSERTNVEQIILRPILGDI